MWSIKHDAAVSSNRLDTRIDDFYFIYYFFFTCFNNFYWETCYNKTRNMYFSYNTNEIILLIVKLGTIAYFNKYKEIEKKSV